MTTLFDAMLNLSRRVRVVRFGLATGGTTTTLIDTVNRNESDDAFNGQTILIFSGDNADTSRQITDFVNSTNTVTVGTAWSNAIVSGVRYGIVNAIREELIQAINAALAEIGHVTKVDDSNLTVVDDQTEYTLPSGVANVVRVEVANDNSGDYDYHAVFNWREINNGKLYFDDEINYTAGRKIRLFYNDEHDSVSADADTIDESIPMPLLGAVAAYWFTIQQYAEHGNMSEKENVILQAVESNMEKAKLRYRVTRMTRTPILGS